MSAAFKPGDLVVLKSGSPVMTIDFKTGEGFVCVYYSKANSAFVKHEFSAEALKAAPASDNVN